MSTRDLLHATFGIEPFTRDHALAAGISADQLLDLIRHGYLVEQPRLFESTLELTVAIPSEAA